MTTLSKPAGVVTNSKTHSLTTQNIADLKCFSVYVSVLLSQCDNSSPMGYTCKIVISRALRMHGIY